MEKILSKLIEYLKEHPVKDTYNVSLVKQPPATPDEAMKPAKYAVSIQVILDGHVDLMGE